MKETNEHRPTVRIAAELVAAYVTNNQVRPRDLPGMIASVHAAFSGLGRSPELMPARPEPAVPVRKSVRPDHIVSLEDGRPYRSLKRHLTSLGLTPDDYRRKWDLPHDYPMIAANYAKRRSELAKAMGLGRKVANVETSAVVVETAAVREAEDDVADVPPVETKVEGMSPTKSGRGRKKTV